MRIDFATLAFGHKITVGGGTPNWATSLGQGKEYKINDDPAIDEVLKGIVYTSVPLSKISTKIGKGGRMVSGSDTDSPIIIASVFSKVFINERLIEGGKYILLITKDTSDSHTGRLRLKYGPSNTYEENGVKVSNQDFLQLVKRQLDLADDACWFVSDISVRNQNELHLRAVIVNANGSVEYLSTAALHEAWDNLEATLFPGTVTIQNENETEAEDEFEMFSPEWFIAKAEDYPELENEAKTLLLEFRQNFNPAYLSTLSGIELIKTIFLNPDNTENLCRVLEFDSQIREVFGSIKGGTSYKYGLFFSSQGQWMTGSHQRPRQLTTEEAIAVGTKLRDHLVAGAQAIAEFGELSTIDDYKKLHKILADVTEGDIERVWFLKYYQMLYPELFATSYSDFALRTILDTLGEEKEKYALVRMGQVCFYAKKCGISNVMFNKIFWAYYSEDSIITQKEKSDDDKFVSGFVCKYPRNRILFGAPGTGKSFTLNKECKELLEHGGYSERVTFHPDYTYANFVGTYKPTPTENDAITYTFVPGPFMRTYVKALKNCKSFTPMPYVLMVEEINRANVAAVFGDVFQLLDRDDTHASEYSIKASEDIKKYLADELGGNPDEYAEIRIPDNMFIWATMNSADQGVFPMDTAFKRRWDFTYLGIDDNEEGIENKKVVLGKGEYERVVEWNELRKAINEELLNYKLNEDKLMGPYFIAKKDIPNGEWFDTDSFVRIFKNKIIMYLFDDAAKQKRITLFGGCEEKAKNQYSKICKEFEQKGVYIFCDNICSKFIDPVSKDDAQ